MDWMIGTTHFLRHCMDTLLQTPPGFENWQGYSAYVPDSRGVWQRVDRASWWVDATALCGLFQSISAMEIGTAKMGTYNVPFGWCHLRVWRQSKMTETKYKQQSWFPQVRIEWHQDVLKTFEKVPRMAGDLGCLLARWKIMDRVVLHPTRLKKETFLNELLKEHYSF